jgi:hypothetical protein
VPVLALVACGGLWVALDGLAGAGATVEFLGYLAVTLPLGLILGRAALGSPPRVSSERHETQSSSSRPTPQLA